MPSSATFAEPSLSSSSSLESTSGHLVSARLTFAAIIMWNHVMTSRASPVMPGDVPSVAVSH